MVEWIGDVSLKAELQRWRYEACRLDYLEKERELINMEEWKLQLAHAGTTRCLAGAVSRRPARPMYPRLTNKRRASYGHAQGLSDWRFVI